MSDNLIDNTICECVKSGDLTTGTANAQPIDRYLRGICHSLYLVKDGLITPSGGPHRVPAGKQVNVRQHGIIRLAHENRLGGRRTHVKTQNAFVTGTDLSLLNGFKFHYIFEIPQGRKGIK